jgi:hypothetical protein
MYISYMTIIIITALFSCLTTQTPKRQILFLDGKHEECCSSCNDESGLVSEFVGCTTDEHGRTNRRCSSDDAGGGRWSSSNDGNRRRKSRSNRRDINRSTSTSLTVRSDRADTSRGRSSTSESRPTRRTRIASNTDIMLTDCLEGVSTLTILVGHTTNHDGRRNSRSSGTGT